MTALDPDSVVDRASFFRFAEALVAERVSAEELERRHPQRYCLGGAEDWQNSTISSYLECALAGAGAQADWGTSSTGPTWRDLAVFLWLGKIYE
ncbi:hypothetical protein [Piscinibacter gummiphilus]|uniref:Uncharacterized protein n=1 Tax=Piscinibacter gummiphilus TaxID=946333 RepID=A0A1W6LBC2_9BURK|nr:hypothetical protein [Piscinibacter gummiphilus]ARN21524.1 hypothetical protein A4W93_17385 [Piscinibacter gummiphilus]ATU66210.1 hypothetical protein CPZ87_17470 [Piscinibacter gummiphilus]GLS96107.1 hypothetical protein GCM10007918_33990 [Piscinibacter gummiphilus]